MRLRHAVLALAVVVHVLVLYAPRTPTGPAVPHLDLVVHVSVFAVVAWAARWCGAPVLPLVLALAAEAAVSEVVQHLLLSARTGDPLDAAADLVGVALGLVLPAGRRPRVVVPGAAAS